jgi:ribosomal 50S subunit-associated protein YjgA (DUF615 family)
MSDDLRHAADAHADARRTYEERRRLGAHEALRAAVEKRLRTTFIGALARFEAAFGRLWGQGKPPGELTEHNRVALAAWEECRKQVLDFGNNQLRAVLKELPQFDVTYKRPTNNLFGRSRPRTNRGDE